MSRLLCIDPSIRALGWAVFSMQKKRRKAELIYSGVIKLRGQDWIAKMDQMVDAVHFEAAGLKLLYKEVTILIEMPQIFGGRGVVAQNSSALYKLIACVFSLRQMFLDLDEEVVLIPVTKWKGQVPKEVTQRRVRKYWKWKGTDHNEADSIGIGDWYIRKELQWKVKP